jgi:hypothetical protein
MIDQSPRKPSFRTLALVAVVSAAVGFFICYLAKDTLDRWFENGDTPIIVRDGSIVITSIGEKLDDFSQPDPKVRLHPRINAKLGKLKVDGQLKGSPCANTKECGVEFVWSTGTPGQSDYREYTVVVGSNSRDGKTAGIVSSVPFSSYDPSGAQNPQTGKWEYSYTWTPAGQTLTFRQARLHTKPFREVSPSLPIPQILCSYPGCKVEFEYK